MDFEVTGYWFWEVRYGRAEEGRSLGLGITFRPVFFFFFSCQVLCRIEEQQHCVPLSPGGQGSVVSGDQAGDLLSSQEPCHHAASASAGLGRPGVCV